MHDPLPTPDRRPARASRRAVLGLGLGLTLTLAACSDDGSTSGEDADGAAGGYEAFDRLSIMAPADPGGGWDQTARTLAQVAEEAGAADATQVTNVGGAGGTIGLAELANERSEEFLMVMGLVMVGAIETNQAQATLDDTTPIARLTAEDLIVVVPAESPYETIEDLVNGIEEDGQDVAVAGGSAGGADHILAGLIVQDAGISIDNLNYIPYSGGGESIAALLGGEVAAGISGVGEYAEQVEAGALRALATSGPETNDMVEAPTLIEAGIDVELTNWRGVVAPPEISDEGRQRLLDFVEEVHGSEEWQAQLETRGWDDAYLAGDEFDAYLAEEKERVRGVLEDIGLVE